MTDATHGAKAQPAPPSPPSPRNGSWVAELEDAKEVLAAAAALRAAEKPPRAGNAGGEDQDGPAALLLEMHLRVCRAYHMLRQWDRLLASAKKGLALCASSASSTTSARGKASSVGASVEAKFREYRKRAKAELAVKSVLTESGIVESRQQANCSTIEDRIAAGGVKYDASPPSRDFPSRMHRIAIIDGLAPDVFVEDGSIFANTNMFQDACLQGDIRYVEAAAALGASLDRPFRKARGDGFGATHDKIVVPASASVLLMACATLAIADSNNPAWAYAKMSAPRNPKTLRGIEECAMQLVRLGADLTRTLKLGGSTAFSPCFRISDLDGKTAVQIASKSKRRELVALMLEHVRLTPEERAEIVHCRCGSRLPWHMCHSTGIGQPPHYIVKSNRIHYRVSPSARCPCGVVPKTYYKCCWRDNAEPTYLDDGTGFHFGSYVNAAQPMLERMKWSTNDTDDPTQADFVEAHNQAKEAVRECAIQFRESPEHFEEFCACVGPKTAMRAWDPLVYAGCIDRLDDPFLWRDVHWDVDRAELLRRTHEWNDALQAYCDDADLVGEERERVFRKHKANPCGPCGHAACPNVESEVREFQRCAKCKRIAYCGRACQKRDWAHHRTVCRPSSIIEVTR
jgi:MYND finger